jgi:hypothetical protein
MNQVVLEKVALGKGPVLTFGLQQGIDLLQRGLPALDAQSATAAHEIQIFSGHAGIHFKQPIAFAALHDPQASLIAFCPVNLKVSLIFSGKWEAISSLSF